ncbi:hypothetical protein AN161_15680 [Lysinibacillus sp. FJAT-14222]|nr:hypothetical protein AN161_15680 [Lysinibacillus sp. FJAT-14222]
MIKWEFLVLVEQLINKQVLNIMVPVLLCKKISLAKKLGSLSLFVIRHVDNLIYCSVLLKG